MAKKTNVKDIEDEELVEEEDILEEDSDESELSEDNFEDMQEDNFDEVSDFSIGDIGLATSNAEMSWKGNLESSLIDAPSGDREEREEEREENNFYQGGVDERESSHYGGVEQGSDFYTEGGRGTDLYSSDSGNYNAQGESGEFYDPRIGKRTDVEEVRQAGKSQLEITGLQSGFGQGTERDVRDKKDDKKYNN